MKKLLLLVFVSFLATTLYSVEFTDYQLNEGFEGGSLPTGWTEEFVTGQHPWQVEGTDLSYPSNAYEGNYRIALRNETNKTIGFTTRLVSPVMNLFDVFRPILIFSHAQAQKTGDFEQLNVYYRTSSESRWVLLKTFDKKITSWQTDTIELVATQTTTYQIAFEATDVLGHGVVLDEIKVRPLPTCEDPNNIIATDIDRNECTLKWNGSFDADSFEIVVATSRIENMEMIDPSIIFHGTTTDFKIHITGLDLGTKYYAYIRSYCPSEITHWILDSLETPSVVKLPYYENFDRKYQASTWPQPKGWTCGTSIYNDDAQMLQVPFINQGTAENSLTSYSKNGTTCLIFSGKVGGLTTLIPQEHYVYAATPQIDEVNFQGVEVSFWLTGGYYVGAYGKGLGQVIVGVMTDPTNFETFVPVDTLYEKAMYAFSYLTADLSKYTGNGRYVAFASNLQNTSNILFIDDVKISRSTMTSAPNHVKISNITPTSFDIEANTHGCDSWSVILTEDVVDVSKNGTQPKKIIKQIDGITDNKYTVKFEERPNRFLTIYVQSKQGNTFSDYSTPTRLRLPMLVDKFPYTIGFEIDGGEATYAADSLVAYTNSSLSDLIIDGIYTPRIMWRSGLKVATTSISTHSGTYKGNINANMYWVLPMVSEENFKKVSISCYIAPWNASFAGKQLEIGVMTDPEDESTFETIGSFAVGSDVYSWTRCFTSVSEYQGEGRYIAMRQFDPATSAGTGMFYIDDITIDTLAGCSEVYNYHVDAEDTQVTLNWAASGVRSWHVIIGTGANGNTITGVLKNEVVTTPRYTINGLKPHTNYYYTVASICGDADLYAAAQSFRTDCAPLEALPYVENFEQYASASTSGIIPSCWTMPTSAGSGAGTLYPYIYSSGFNDSKRSLYFYQIKKSAYFALPEFTEPDVSKLELSLVAKNNVNTPELLTIGVMTNPDDTSTFQVTDTFQLTQSWQEIIVNFKNYKGAGKHIAIKRGISGNHFLIDDIQVKYLSECAKVQNVRASRLQSNGATLTWRNIGAPEYEVVILDTMMNIEEAIETKIHILIDSVVNVFEFPCYNDVMTVNNNYYAYVRSRCSEHQYGEWSLRCAFKTACDAVTPENYGAEDFTETSVLDCWSIGCASGTATVQRHSTYKCLYLQHAATSDNAYAIAAPIDFGAKETDVCEYQISFDAHAGTTAAGAKTISVGLISDIEDLSTAEIIKKLPLELVSALSSATNYGFKESLRYTVRFNQYAGDYTGQYGNRVIFLTEAGGVIEYAYIKNIVYEKIGNVPEPIEMMVRDVLDTAATIEWEAIAGSFEVKLATSNIDPTVVEGMGVYKSQTNNITIEGLSANTKYYYYIRTINNNDTSKWSNGRSFTTDCPLAAKLPYSENFDNCKLGGGTPPVFTAPECWTRYFGGGVPATTEQSGAASATAKFGTSGAGVYMSSIASTFKDNFIISPAMSDEMLNGLLSFNVKAANATGIRTIVVGVTEFVEPFEDFNESVVWLDTVVIDNTDEWKSVSVLFDKYQGNGRHFVIGCVGGMGGTIATAGVVYIDNVVLETKPLCIKPDMLSFVSATPQSITVNWMDEFGSKWNVRYGAAGADVADMKTISVTETTATLTDLTINTEYDIYVQTDCGENQSIWIGPITESTLCLVPLAEATWNFDEVNDEKHPTTPTSTAAQIISPCWLSGNTLTPTTTANIPYTIVNTKTSRYSYSGDYALKLGTTANNGAYAVIPMIDANNDTLQVTFKTRMVSGTTSVMSGDETKYTTTYTAATYDRNFKIGTMDSPYEPETFKPLATHQVAVNTATTKRSGDWWEDVTVSLYGTQGKYIAFYVDNAKTCAYIDDVVVSKEGSCPAPTGIELDQATSNENHAEFNWVSSKNEWNIQVLEGTTEIKTATVTEKHFAIDGLKPNTEYTFRIQTKVASELSDWKELVFTTPCAKTEKAEATWNFDDDYESYYLSGATYYYRPSCWLNGLMDGSTRFTPTNFAQTIANEPTKIYSHDYNPDNVTDGRALKLYSSGTSYYGSYAIMPEMNFAIDTMALHFYARHGHVTKATGKFAQTTAAYPHEITIGYVVDNDILTFVPIETVTITLSADVTTSTDATTRGDLHWDEFTVELKDFPAKDVRIAFVYAYNNPTTGHVYVDDVAIVPSDYCVNPTNVNVLNQTSSSVTIGWQCSGKQVFEVEVAEDENFDNIVAKDSVNTNTFTASGLKPQTVYYYQVRHLCSDTEISDWQTASFKTNYVLPFAENFDDINIYPIDWIRRAGPTDYGFSLTQFLAGQVPALIASTSTTGWVNDGHNTIMPGTHMSVKTSTPYPAGLPADIHAILGDNNHAPYFLYTPIIDLSGVSDSIMLSFDLALTASTLIGRYDDEYDAPNLNDNTEDYFAVFISDDGGITWLESNMTKWSNKGDGEYVYNEIPNAFGGKKYFIDMTRYCGKQVQICFHSGSAQTGSSNALHIDNVQFNRYTTISYSAQNCQFEDFDNGDFTIDADDLLVGTTDYNTYIPTDQIMEKDRKITMRLNVAGSATKMLFDTICEGYPYRNYNFDFIASRSGTYKQKLQAANGCDSIVVMDLTVIPAQKSLIEATICYGAYYTFCGKDYFHSVVVTDTIESAIGCDSIATLYLTVTPILEGSEDFWLCPGGEIELGTLGKITQAGIYVDTIKTESGCDSVATWTVHQATAGVEVRNRIICQGENYTDDIYRGLTKAGEYPVTTQTEHGCDSTVILNLYVADGDGHVQINIPTEELPLVVNGEELLPAGTKDGYYEKPITVGSCGEVIAQITVGKASALDNIHNIYDQLQKVIYQDQIYVIKNGTWYNVLGEIVPALW